MENITILYLDEIMEILDTNSTTRLGDNLKNNQIDR